MPRIVDQDQKRADIARAAYEVITRDGIGGATMRTIAKQAGCSTGMLVHYFSNKQDVLLNAHEHAAKNVRQRMVEYQRDLQGLTLLRALIEEVLPVDERRKGNWIIWISFWDPSVADSELKSEQAKRITEWHRRLKGALTQAEALGELRAGTNVQDEVDRIASMVEGLAIQVIVHRRAMSGARMLRLIEGYFLRLAAS